MPSIQTYVALESIKMRPLRVITPANNILRLSKEFLVICEGELLFRLVRTYVYGQTQLVVGRVQKTADLMFLPANGRQVNKGEILRMVCRPTWPTICATCYTNRLAPAMTR